jgi:hypothetical protein
MLGMAGAPVQAALIRLLVVFFFLFVVFLGPFSAVAAVAGNSDGSAAEV